MVKSIASWLLTLSAVAGFVGITRPVLEPDPGKPLREGRVLEDARNTGPQDVVRRGIFVASCVKHHTFSRVSVEGPAVVAVVGPKLARADRPCVTRFAQGLLLWGRDQHEDVQVVKIIDLDGQEIARYSVGAGLVGW